MKIDSRGNHGLVVAGAVVCLVAGVLVWRTSLTATPKRAPRTQEGEVAERVSTAWVDTTPEPAAAAAVVPIRAISTAQPVRAPEESKPAAPSMEDQRAYLQTGFDREPVDRTWARDARTELRSAIQKRIPTSASLSNVECRSSLCRAEIAFEGPEDYRRFLRDSRPVWTGASALVRTGSGEDWSMVGFFAKPGQTLPILE